MVISDGPNDQSRKDEHVYFGCKRHVYNQDYINMYIATRDTTMSDREQSLSLPLYRPINRFSSSAVLRAVL